MTCAKCQANLPNNAQPLVALINKAHRLNDEILPLIIEIDTQLKKAETDVLEMKDIIPIAQLNGIVTERIKTLLEHASVLNIRQVPTNDMNAIKERIKTIRGLFRDAILDPTKLSDTADCIMVYKTIALDLEELRKEVYCLHNTFKTIYNSVVGLTTISPFKLPDETFIPYKFEANMEI